MRKPEPIGSIVSGVKVFDPAPDGTQTYSPASGDVIGFVSDAPSDLIDRAVTAARSSFERGDWRRRPPRERRETLHRLGALIDVNAQLLGTLDSEDMGKPITAAIGEAHEAAQMIRAAGDLAEHLTGALYPTDQSTLAFSRHEPLGVVAAITPWNYPMPNLAHKLGPGLAAGNAFILKPSEISSRSAVEVVTLAHQAGIPPETLHIVTGRGATAGAALAGHKDIDLVSFTGSTMAGHSIMAAAARSNGKRLLLECGGKSPQIVFDDVDLEAIVPWLAAHAFANSGQLCVAKSRLLIQRSIMSRLVDMLVEEVVHHLPGDPSASDTRYGPISFRRQYDCVQLHIDRGRRGTAKLVAGGDKPFADVRGLFVAPTVFAYVDPHDPLAQEEIFGPVLVVIGFDDEDDAVRIANATVYGLSASIWTRDLARAHRLSQQIEAGVIDIFAAPPANTANVPHFPSEPAKQSGFGIEGGVDGVRAYTYRKGVAFYT